MDEYLEKVISQIRCKKARPYIKGELKSHIEDQIADNVEAGMHKAEAEKSAVEDMGDPVEAGISLDLIHKPQVAWKLLALITVISIIGILIHGLISYQLRQYEGEALLVSSGSENYIISVLAGILIMFLIYLVDYTTIARFSKLIAIGFLGFILAGITFGVTVNGRMESLGVGSVRVSLSAIMMLYVPIYGAVIYKYHGTGYRGLCKSILWMIVPVLLAFRLPSVMLAGVLLISMMVQLTIAIANNWFCVSGKKVIAGLWGCAVGLPVFGLAGMYGFHLLASYQEARIRAFLTSSGDAGYLTSVLRSLLKSSRLVGNSGQEIIGVLPDFNSDHILAYLITSYGLLAGIGICCIMSAVILLVFGASLQQKNQLGMVMGCGCGMIFLLNAVINVLENIGAFPPTQTFLPFFSAGGSGIVLSYALVGIILSIYRFKNVYPKHVKTGFKLTAK